MQRIRLHQHSLKIDSIQQLPQRRDFTASVGGVGALGDGDTQSAGVEADLGHETRCARSGLIHRAPERLAVTDQGVHLCVIAELGTHPTLEKVLKALHVKLGEQQAEGGI